jgi:hypothetical protein
MDTNRTKSLSDAMGFAFSAREIQLLFQGITNSADMRFDQ